MKKYEQLTLDEQLGLRFTKGYYGIKIGDICPKCKTTVKEQWSGIACRCGYSWHCA